MLRVFCKAGIAANCQNDFVSGYPWQALWVGSQRIRTTAMHGSLLRGSRLKVPVISKFLLYIAIEFGGNTLIYLPLPFMTGDCCDFECGVRLQKQVGKQIH